MHPSPDQPRRGGVVTTAAYRMGKHPPNFGHTYPAEVLTRGEIDALLAACSRRGAAGTRNAAMIVVLWRTGLRIAEALALLPKDIDLQAGTITVLRGKGAKRRVVGIDAQAVAVLERWLDRRRALGIGPRSTVFCQIQQPRIGQPWSSSAVREALKTLAVKAGIDKRVHPHGFRHTMAFELAMEKQPLGIIRAQLGHSKLATTAHYIDHLAPVEALAAIQARSWTPAV